MCSCRCSSCAPASGSVRCIHCSRFPRRPPGSSDSSARGPRSRAIPQSPTSRARSACVRSSWPTPPWALPRRRGHRLEPPRRAPRSGRTAGDELRGSVRGIRPARARVGAELVRAGPGRSAHRTGRPGRPRDRRTASPRSRSRRARCVPGPCPLRPPGSPDAVTPGSTVCSAISASNRAPRTRSSRALAWRVVVFANYD